MKLNALILLVLFQLSAFSQKDSIIIKGTVTSTESRTIQNALVHLVSSQGHRYECKTDSSGTYRFHLYSESAFSCTVTVASDKRTSSGLRRNLGFQATRDHAVFELMPGKIYGKNFTLIEIVGCETFIELLFQTQSTASVNDSLQKTDSLRYKSLDYAITDLSYMLKDNPGIVIELQGHASVVEKDPEQLSLKRAEYVRQLLIEKGIHPGRLETKGFGVRKLLVSDAVIKKAKTKEEKMALHVRNQRVVFRIINWDFKE